MPGELGCQGSDVQRNNYTQVGEGCDQEVTSHLEPHLAPAAPPGSHHPHTWHRAFPEAFPGQSLHWLREMPRSSGVGSRHTLSTTAVPGPFEILFPPPRNTCPQTPPPPRSPPLLRAYQPQADVVSPSLKIPAVLQLSPWDPVLPSRLRYTSRCPGRRPGPVNSEGSVAVC